MGMTHEQRRVYVMKFGWTPIVYKEKLRKVLAWEHKESGRFCQDIEDAYHCEHYKQEVLDK